MAAIVAPALSAGQKFDMLHFPMRTAVLLDVSAFDPNPSEKIGRTSTPLLGCEVGNQIAPCLLGCSTIAMN